MMREFFLICSAFCFLASASHVMAAKGSDALDIRTVKKKIRELKTDITEMQKTVENLETEHRALVVELSDFERKFQDRFSKVVAPLLSWPQLPPAFDRTTWVEDSHLKLVLSKARERLVKEPLELIAERELMIERAQKNKDEVSAALKSLESKEGLLNLQLEELQFLQKKFSRAKRN